MCSLAHRASWQASAKLELVGFIDLIQILWWPQVPYLLI